MRRGVTSSIDDIRNSPAGQSRILAPPAFHLLRPRNSRTLYLGTLSRLRGGKRRTLTSAFEPDAAGGTRANSAAFHVCHRYQRIIERRLYVNDRLCHILPDFMLCYICHCSKSSANQIMKTKNYPRISFTPFFPATVFLGPLRVLALVRVRWP
jgi:hypothetical protein